MSRPCRPTSSRASLCSGGVFDWEPALRKLDELNARVEDPTLWDNPDEAQAVSRETCPAEDQINGVRAMQTGLEEAVMLSRWRTKRATKRPRRRPHPAPVRSRGGPPVRSWRLKGFTLKDVDISYQCGSNTVGKNDRIKLTLSADQGVIDSSNPVIAKMIGMISA